MKNGITLARVIHRYLTMVDVNGSQLLSYRGAKVGSGFYHKLARTRGTVDWLRLYK